MLPGQNTLVYFFTVQPWYEVEFDHLTEKVKKIKNKTK